RPVLVLGQPGGGTPHLAIALAVLAVEAGNRGYSTSADDMVRNLAHAMIDGTFASKLRTYTAPTVLVIDDVGLLPIEASRGAIAFFQSSTTATKHDTPPS